MMWDVRFLQQLSTGERGVVCRYRAMLWDDGLMHSVLVDVLTAPDQTLERLAPDRIILHHIDYTGPISSRVFALQRKRNGLQRSTNVE